MYNSESYSNNDDVASASWPDPLWTMGDYPDVPVLQDTQLDLISTEGYPSTASPYIPDFNTADDPAFTLAPTTELGAFTNPQTQVDHTYQVSIQRV